ncbi:MAG: hypothetical protein HYU02_04880, partial [Thaumarchaeota archaeon]|nr:hypothetical protein [Nitrososphaerota archaeon]
SSVRYQDDAAVGSQSTVGFARAKATANVVIGSTTGTVTTSPATEVGPFSTIVITVVDADLAFNKTRVVLDKITSELTSDEVNSIVAVKANRTTGTYTFNVTIAFSTSPVTTDQILQVNSTDRIHVFYTDRLNNAGSVEIIEKIIRVTTGDGTITVDKANYLVGEFITITIVDTDANRDSTLREFVRPVVTTDSWTVGSNITLQETAADSGIFVGQVQITDTFPGAGQVLGKIGDSISVRYIDLLGADRQRKIITVSPARIGTSVPKTQQVPADVPATVDANGNLLTTIRAGDLVAVRAKITNNDTVSHTLTYFVQVKDANGVVVNLAFIQDITLGVGTSTSPALIWIPSRAGTYTVEVFVWESIANPIALSPAQKITVQYCLHQ